MNYNFRDSRIGYVTEVISENQIELTFDTEDGIEKVVYYFPLHSYKEGDKVEETFFLSKVEPFEISKIYD
jgi:hypothetical protein